jgi:hypothetical protein
MAGSTQIYTDTINGDIVNITSSDNILRLSVIVQSGTVVITGSAVFQGGNSNPIILNPNQGLTLGVESITQPLSGVEIDATSGSCDVIMCTS